MQTLPEYSYVTAANLRRFVAASDVTFTGTWSGTNIYVGDADVVTWGTDAAHFIATENNINTPPFVGPWTFLTQIAGTTPPAPAPAPTPFAIEVGGPSNAFESISLASVVAIYGGTHNPPPELGQPDGSLYLSSASGGIMFFHSNGTWGVK